MVQFHITNVVAVGLNVMLGSTFTEMMLNVALVSNWKSISALFTSISVKSTSSFRPSLLSICCGLL